MTLLSPNKNNRLKKAPFHVTAIASLLTAAFWSNDLYHEFWPSSIANILGNICSGFLHKATLAFSKAESFSYVCAFESNSIAVISRRRSETSSFPYLSMEIELNKQFPSPELCKALECAPQSKGMRDFSIQGYLLLGAQVVWNSK